MNDKRQPILRVENLKHYFKSGVGKNKIVVKAVDDVSFNIYKGEVFSLVGESGCGKTTTGRSLIKLYKGSEGNVYFHDQRIIADVKHAKELYKLGEISLEEYRQARYDKKFERVVTPEMKQRAKEVTDESPEVIEYREELAKKNEVNKQRVEELSVKRDQMVAEFNNSKDKDLKDEIKELNSDIRDLQKAIRYNETKQRKAVRFYRKQILNSNRDLMRKMQMIFQDPIASLNPRMTVKEIIAEGLRINGEKDEAEITRRVKEALTIVGLVPEHAARYPHEFSGGQRQRIGIARALVSDPSFIIADEPISALDVSIRAQVINLLNDLRENHGVTILFIAHDLSVVKYFSDRVAVMYYGKVVEMGKKELIFDNTLHPYTLSLIDAIPLPDPLYEQARGDLKRYNPHTAHDYSVEGPTLREVEPDHFVLCNTAEFEKYQAQIAANKKKK